MTDDPTDQALCGGVPFAPTAEEEAADQSAEVARLREALGGVAPRSAAECLRRSADELRDRGYIKSAELHERLADVVAALAAPAAQDDRSAPEDRERWIAEWKKREGGG